MNVLGITQEKVYNLFHVTETHVHIYIHVAITYIYLYPLAHLIWELEPM